MKTQTQVTVHRPVPIFDAINEEVFSTKKARAQTERKYRPPPPPHPARIRSTFCRSRVRSCLPAETGASAISFRQDSDSSASMLANSVYNTADHHSFMDQCFTEKRVIGCGCFGEVYSARSRLDGKMYAIKKSRQGFRSNADRRRRLEEVRKHERLPPHRHCVAFHSAWEEQDHLYMQTELCATSLADLAATDHSIAEATVWSYMVDLLLAVKHLHDNELVHLDIKPENIFIMKEGYLKLGDFGLVMDCSTNRDLNDSDATEGDPKYMAPELMRGQFSPAADLFSVGLTLLELACDLELPPGAHGWHLLRAGRIPDPLRAALSPQLRDVLERMLDPDPASRATVDQLLQLPAVRAARRRRRLQIAVAVAMSSVRDGISGVFSALHSLLLFLLFLLAYPLRWLWRGEGAPRSQPAADQSGAPSPETPAAVVAAPVFPPPPHERADCWLLENDAFSDLDDDILETTLDELHHTGPRVRNSTPKLETSRSRLRLRRTGSSLRRELGIPNGHVPEEEAAGEEEPSTPMWPPAVRGRRLEESFNSVSPRASRSSGRRSLRQQQQQLLDISRVQVKLDFRADLSDEDQW